MRKKGFRIEPIFVLGIIIIIVLVVIVIGINRSKKVDYANMTEEEFVIATGEKIKQLKTNELAKLDERARIERYVSVFAKYVENKNYESAYNLLNDRFKEKYFPTLESFTTYAQRAFPQMMALNHENIERNGNTYVLWTKLSSALSSKDASIDINFVVKENDVNDFELSFSVIDLGEE